MSEVLTVSGNLEGVAVRLGRIKAIIDYRKAEGYPAFHAEERWRYVTHPERSYHGPCPVCRSHDGKIYAGDIVKQLFPYAEYIGGYRANPNTHEPDRTKFMNAPCVCELVLMNPAESFEARMSKEKLGVI